MLKFNYSYDFDILFILKVVRNNFSFHCIIQKFVKKCKIFIVIKLIVISNKY